MSNLIGLSQTFDASLNYLYGSNYFRLTISLFSVLFIWLICRKRKVKLNCWFCSTDSLIPVRSKSWWICSACNQYNGFKENGDYKEEISEMYEGSNTPKFCVTPKEVKKRTNLFCSNCLYNQNRIIEKLADFSPSDDKFFDAELEKYKRELDAKWGLCLPCQTAVSYHLQEQNTQIQNYINNIQSSADKALRKLKMKLYTPNNFVIGLYELINFFSFYAGIWLYRHNGTDYGADAMLISACTMFTIFTLLICVNTRKYKLSGILISLLWLIIYLYGSYSTRDSQYLRRVTLFSLTLFEGFYLFHSFISCLIKLWKSSIYKQERGKKVEKMCVTPKREQEDYFNIGSKKACRSLDVLTGKQPGQPVSLGPFRCSTPDLLEGHLDAMYIERGAQEHLPSKVKDANHVVAALKYRSISYLKSEQRISGQSILRPATFVAFPRSSILNGELENVSPKVVSRNAEHKTTECMDMEDKIYLDKSKDEIDISNGNMNLDRRVINWTKVIIFGSIFSIICNLFLAYKLIYISK